MYCLNLLRRSSPTHQRRKVAEAWRKRRGQSSPRRRLESRNTRILLSQDVILAAIDSIRTNLRARMKVLEVALGRRRFERSLFLALSIAR